MKTHTHNKQTNKFKTKSDLKRKLKTNLFEENKNNKLKQKNKHLFKCLKQKTVTEIFVKETTTTKTKHTL